VMSANPRGRGHRRLLSAAAPEGYADASGYRRPSGTRDRRGSAAEILVALTSGEPGVPRSTVSCIKSVPTREQGPRADEPRFDALAHAHGGPSRWLADCMRGSVGSLRPILRHPRPIRRPCWR
jgi:hypothetical protein